MSSKKNPAEWRLATKLVRGGLKRSEFGETSEAIFGLKIDIETMEGKWKLSQNRQPEERANIALALVNLGGDNNTGVAALMNAEPRELHQEIYNE